MTQGERVKEIRKELGLTLDKFGEKVGVTKQTISRIENGVNKLTVQMQKAICREYNVNVNYLVDGTGEMFIEPKDDVADLVSNLVDEENPFYDLILDIMRTYDQLDDKGKEIFNDAADKLAKRISEKNKK